MAEFNDSTRTIELLHDSTPDQTPSPQFLSVDDTKRPRANSDPVGLHIHISNVPEITVTGEDCRDGGRTEDDESDSFLIPPSPRRRANTCPEDMFRTRKGRPPTPPPMDIRILRTSAGKRFSFNFPPKDMGSVSFAHHRLSKVSEEKAEQQLKTAASQHRELAVRNLPNAFSCSLAAAPINDNCTTHTNDVNVRLQSHPDDAEARTEHSCDHYVSTQLSGLSVADNSVAETTNNNEKPLIESSVNADVLTSSSDSWKSKDSSRDNLDNQRLKAY